MEKLEEQINVFDETKTVGNTTIICSNRIRKFRNVIVSRHGMVLDQKFRRVPEANQQFDFWSRLWASWWKPAETMPEEMMEVTSKPLVELEDEDYIYALHYQDSVPFGHIWDIIQSLYYVNNSGLHGKLLCNWHTDIPNIDFHWSAFGYGSHARVPIDTKNYNYLVPTLYVPSLPAPPGEIREELVDWLKSWWIG